MQDALGHSAQTAANSDAPSSFDPLHFTYASEARKDLQQGDLLKRTDKVCALLEEVHPHYFRGTGYEYFLVLTQSCDLVRRNGQCKSHYVTIAAVRPLSKALERELAAQVSNPIEMRVRFSSEDKRQRLVLFLQRLLNNNEPEYFYLHREPEVGLNGDFCAFLRLSISVKAELHYETLLAARILQLRESFQHKLGYLVGNMYARIGTTDWAEENREAEFHEHTQKPVKSLLTWLQKDVHKTVLERLVDLEAKEKREISSEDLVAVVQDVQRQKQARKEQLLKALQDVLETTGIEKAIAQKVVARFSNVAEFAPFK